MEQKQEKKKIDFSSPVINPFDELGKFDEIEQKFKGICNALQKEYNEKEGPKEFKTMNQLLIEFYEKKCNAPYMRTREEWDQQDKEVKRSANPFYLWEKKAKGKYGMKAVYTIKQVYNRAWLREVREKEWQMLTAS